MKAAGYAFALCLAATAPALPLGGCTGTDPATGSRIFTAGMSPEREASIGRANHPKFVKMFGGEYGSRELKEYIASIGRFLASTSELPDLEFTFTILNSPTANAFAAPGGYIYLTRGLLTLANDEAEIAAVLAHEIGHVTARHGARSHGRTVIATIGMIGLNVLGSGRYDDLARLGTTGALRSFSREHEHEADRLAIRYLARAGYDPGAMGRFLTRLRDSSRLDAKRRGASPDAVDRFNYLATHPAPIERIGRATRMARAVNVNGPITARDIYFSKISGIVFGDDREQGFVRGRDFLHPAARFAFRVPPGFSLFNSPDAVAAFGPARERILFDQEQRRFAGSMISYLRDFWAGGRRLAQLEALRVNGVEAATATTRLRTRDGALDARLAAYRTPDQSIYRFIFLTPPDRTRALSIAFRRALRSFRVLTSEEAARLKPYRLRIVTVGNRDSIESLAHRQPFADYRVERFAVLNGISPGASLRPGTNLKLVVEDSGNGR